MLTPEQAKKVLEADLANLVKKVKDGGILSVSERSRLEEMGDSGLEAETITDLSNLLGVSRQTIYNWKELDGHPSGLNIGDWKAFMEERELSGGSGTGKMNLGGRNFSVDDVADLKAQLLTERTGKEAAERSLKEIELKKGEEGWIPKSEAEDLIKRILEPLARLLSAFPRRYAMRVNPENPEGTEEVLTSCCNDVIRQLHADRGKGIRKRKGVK